MRVRLTSEPNGAICLESPYDRTFVEGLKRALDYGGRAWDPGRKRWIVSALYAEALLQYLHAVGASIQDDREGEGSHAVAALPPMPADLKEAFDALFLAYTAPLCVAEGSYRALSKYFHPDKGGNQTDFHRVNDAIDIVRKYLDPQPETIYDPNDEDIPF
jgi:hypothetical protein